MALKVPYSLSRFKELIHEGYHYVDRTRFIETLERIGVKYVYFLRPRRFGKSLWISTLENYYGLEHKEDFQATFGSLHIGQNPTALANQYLILRLNFSQVDTDSSKTTYQDFFRNVQSGLSDFFKTYGKFFPPSIEEKALQGNSPMDLLKNLIDFVKKYVEGHKVYLLIDEYDHFANEILAMRSMEFHAIVGQNGWVRKFYETIKAGVERGAIDRIFITGVSPITLDSMTSGFNIASNLTNDFLFHDLMGFRETEVREFLDKLEVPSDMYEQTLDQIRTWYNGYRFHGEATESLYNPNMILYFANHYVHHRKYPKQILDFNITSDTTKIKNLFESQADNYFERLKEVLNYKEEPLIAQLTEMFNLERRLSRDGFISLLYYMGMLTITGNRLDDHIFAPPNYVITKIYFEYFFEQLVEGAEIPKGQFNIRRLMQDLALNNDIPALGKAIQEFLSQLSSRDSIQLSEKHIKFVLISFLLHTDVYTVKSEYGIGGKYADIVLLRNPPYPGINQFILELKYLPKSSAAKVEKVQAAARQQLNEYLQHDSLKSLTHLKAWVILIIGFNQVLVEEVSV